MEHMSACKASWEGTASLYRQWHCTFSQYDQTNIAKYLSVPWTTTTTNPCCPLPREACALEACPHLAWRTLATAWQQLPLSWPSPMLPHRRCFGRLVVGMMPRPRSKSSSCLTSPVSPSVFWLSPGLLLASFPNEHLPSGKH